MSSSGHLSTKTSSLLTLLRAFPKETNYFVLKQLLTTVSTTLDTWIFQDSRSVDALERFQLDLVSSSLPYPGSSIHLEHSDSMLEQMSKALLFEHAAAHPKVKEDAERMFLRFVAGDRNAININILETVLKIVLRGDNTPLAVHPPSHSPPCISLTRSQNLTTAVRSHPRSPQKPQHATYLTHLPPLPRLRRAR